MGLEEAELSPVFYLNKVNIVPKFQKDVPFGRL